MAAVVTPDAPARKRSWLRFALAVAAILMASGLAQVRWGERLPVGRGAGWDGREYARIARDLPGEVGEGRLDGYRLRRVVPSALVYATLALLDRAPTVGRIARMFGYWNVVFLVTTGWAWAAITRTMAIGTRGRWLGVILLFVNFANLKMPFYYPVLTDSAALCLGALLLLFHLRDQAIAMWTTLLVAAFTWPSLALLGAALFVFRRRPLEADGEGSGRALVAAAVALSYVVAVTLVREGVPPMGSLRFVVSVAVGALFLFVATWSLVAAPRAWVVLLADRVSWRRLVVLVATLFAVEGVVAAWSTPTPFTYGYFLHRLLVLSVAQPGLFLVAHPVYLGLVVPLLALFWPEVVRTARGLGAGVMLFLWGHLVWGLHPESRTAIDVLPLLVLLVTVAAESRLRARGGLVVLGVLALAVSKVWLPLNARVVYGEHIQVPWYSMHHGPLMTAQDYAWQAAGLLAVSALLLFLVRARGGGGVAGPPAPVAQAS
jgi:hypothetical protein